MNCVELFNSVHSELNYDHDMMIMIIMIIAISSFSLVGKYVKNQAEKLKNWYPESSFISDQETKDPGKYI